MEFSRREFLKAAAGSALCAASSISIAASDIMRSNDENFWAKPRSLSLWRSQTGESITATYWKNNNFEVEGYLKICELMRDTKEKAIRN